MYILVTGLCLSKLSLRDVFLCRYDIQAHLWCAGTEGREQEAVPASGRQQAQEQGTLFFLRRRISGNVAKALEAGGNGSINCPAWDQRENMRLLVTTATLPNTVVPGDLQSKGHRTPSELGWQWLSDRSLGEAAGRTQRHRAPPESQRLCLGRQRN